MRWHFDNTSRKVAGLSLVLCSDMRCTLNLITALNPVTYRVRLMHYFCNITKSTINPLTSLRPYLQHKLSLKHLVLLLLKPREKQRKEKPRPRAANLRTAFRGRLRLSSPQILGTSSEKLGHVSDIDPADPLATRRTDRTPPICRNIDAGLVAISSPKPCACHAD